MFILYLKILIQSVINISLKKPTNGFRALSMVFEAKSRKIFIAGFIFFKNPYTVGYRDSLRDLDVSKENEKKRGLHDPDLEFKIFLNFLENSNSEILLDKNLKSMVSKQI